MVRLTLVAALVACSQGAQSSKPAAFECYKVGSGDAGWRECGWKLSSCADRGGCIQRETAHCFPYLLTGFADKPDRRAMICTPSKEECEAWNEDRQHVMNKALGPCALARPDEYIDEPVPERR